MKKTNLYIGALSLLISSAALTSCETDLEHYNVDAPQAAKVAASCDAVEVTESNVDDVLLKFDYSSLGPLTVNGGFSTNQGIYEIQLSASETFDTYVSKQGSSKSGQQSIELTGDEINVMAFKLGLEGAVFTPLYARLASLYNEASAKDAQYSDVVIIRVKPLKILMNYLAMAFKSDAREDAVDSLYSAAEDGIYTGFMGVASWWNWCAYDALGVRYSTDDSDPAGSWPFAHMYPTVVDGSNMWFPGIAGCYYVTANANTGAVDYAYIPALTVSGDASAVLSFSSANCQWTGVISTSADNQVIRISGDTYTFNQATGQGDEIDDDAEDGTPAKGSIAFAASGNVLSIAQAADAIVVPKAGQYMLTVDLNNSACFTYKIQDMGGVKMFPSRMTVMSGSTSAEMDVEMANGLATGRYTKYAFLGSGDITFTDGSEVMPLNATAARTGWYMISLDLAENTLSVTAYNNTLEVLGFWSGMLSINDNGHYTGIMAPGSDWNFYLVDVMGNSFATYKGWDQFTFGPAEGDYDHLWLDPACGTVKIDIDPEHHSWSYIECDKYYIIDADQSTVAATFEINSDGYYEASLLKESHSDWNYWLLYVDPDGACTYYGCDSNVDWDGQCEQRYGTNRSGTIVAGGQDISSANNEWADNSKSWKIVVDFKELKFVSFDEIQ